jgi:hypothetical protein
MDFRLAILIVFVFFCVLAMGILIGFLLGKRSDSEEERIDEILEQAITFLVLYYFQPSKVNEEEVKVYLESIGAIEENPVS